MPLLQHPARVARPQVPFHVARPAATRFAKRRARPGTGWSPARGWVATSGRSRLIQQFSSPHCRTPPGVSERAPSVPPMTRQRNNRRPREGRADRVEQFTRQGSEAHAAEGSDRAPRSSLDMGRQGSRRAATARWRNQRSRGGIVMDHEPARVSTVVPTCAFLMILQTPSRGELHCCNSLWDLIKKSSSDASRLGVGARKPRQQTVSSLSASGPRGSPRDNRVPDVT